MRVSIVTVLASAAFVGYTSAFSAPTTTFVGRPACLSRGFFEATGRSNVLSMSVSDITSAAEDKMGKSIESVKQSLQSVRTGRANANILDRVQVEYYEVMTPLNQLATISVPSAQQLQIDPFDKSIATDIEKAIIESGLGLTPNNDGQVLRINIPQLTEDRRKELLKQCKEIGEDGKVSIRNVRRDGVDKIKKLEKNGEVGKDEMQDGLDSMQKITDASSKDIDEIVSKKEKEVMTV